VLALQLPETPSWGSGSACCPSPSAYAGRAGRPFPPTDIAEIGRGFGCEAVTVRRREDLAPVKEWLEGPRDRPLVVAAKVTRDRPAWWLEEAFRGH
jgi:thiamine pyrophosphate-dependent acetolactate synthase large subunit-like protein